MLAEWQRQLSHLCSKNHLCLTPALLYLLIKADRRINQGLCVCLCGSVHVRWCLCGLMGQTPGVWAARLLRYEEMTDSCHVFITADWYLSEAISVMEDLRVSLSQETAYCTTAPVGCQASPTAERRLESACADEITPAFIYITFCHITIYHEPLLLFLLCIAGYCIMWSCCYYSKSNVAWTHNWIYSDDY